MAVNRLSPRKVRSIPRQSGYGKAHLSTKNAELTDEQKRRNKAIVDDIAQNGSIKAFVKDAASVGALFGRFMTQGVILGQYDAADFKFEGREMFIQEPAPNMNGQPFYGDIQNTGIYDNGYSDYLLFGSDDYGMIPPGAFELDEDGTC